MSRIVFIGMKTSGVLRRGFQSLGFETYSCDLLPSEDGGAGHIVGDVFDCLKHMQPSLAIFHPTCTYLTNSAAWAYKDPPYHQRLKPGTLFGAARREAREKAIADVLRIDALPIPMKAVENPVGILSTRWRKPNQIVQPYQYGDDASKATCLWLTGLPNLQPTNYFPPRLVCANCSTVNTWRVHHKCGICDSHDLLPRWSNQTDEGQNNMPPDQDRWKERSRTFPGLAAAMVSQWAPFVPEI